MKTSDKIDELATALVKFQAAITNVGKDSRGHGYNYASLDAVLEITRPHLEANGLSFVQMPGIADPGYLSLTTRLMHISGQWLEHTMEIPAPTGARMNDTQAYGAAITYARRYAYSAMLGIATEEDTDARPKAPAPNTDARGATSPQSQAEREAMRPTANGDLPTLGSGQLDVLRSHFHAVGFEKHGDAWEQIRREYCERYGVESSNDLNVKQAKALIEEMER